MRKEKIKLDIPSRDTRAHQKLGATTTGGARAKVACRQCGTVSAPRTKPNSPIFDCPSCGGMLYRMAKGSPNA